MLSLILLKYRVEQKTQGYRFEQVERRDRRSRVTDLDILLPDEFDQTIGRCYRFSLFSLGFVKSLGLGFHYVVYN